MTILAATFISLALLSGSVTHQADVTSDRPTIQITTVEGSSGSLEGLGI